MWKSWGYRAQAHPDLLRFEDAFIKAAAYDGIPLYVVARSRSTVEVFHAQWEDRLGGHDWRLIGELGLAVARKLEGSWMADGRRLPPPAVTWGGTLHGWVDPGNPVGPAPAFWEVDCCDGCSD